MRALGAFDGSPRSSKGGQRICVRFESIGKLKYPDRGVRGRCRALGHEGPSSNVRPSWSGDGRWIYFGSDPGEWQIWKVPPAGGAAIQVTHNGGREAVETPDGRYVYYAKGSGVRGIWQVPVAGGDEQQVIDRGVEAWWALTERGIVLVD
jgi:hypothetical protein